MKLRSGDHIRILDNEICIPMFFGKTAYAFCSRHCPGTAKERYKDDHSIEEELARV